MTRHDIPVRYSAELYDHYTAGFIPRYDEYLEAKVVKHHLKRRATPVLLDVGAGTAQFLLRLAGRPELDGLALVALDFFGDMAALARRNLTERVPAGRATVVQGDAHALPLGGATAGYVVSRSTLHHWHDPAAALAEMHRVLAPGGVAIVHDIRRDPAPAVLEAFNRRRAEAGVPPCNIDEKHTPGEVREMLRRVGLAGCSEVSTTDQGPGALGMEVLVWKQ